MSRPRYLADHNFHKGIVLGVRRQEPAVEIIQVQDLKMEKSPDEEFWNSRRFQGRLF